MTTDAIAAARAAVHPLCEPAVSCATCGSKVHPFFRIIRLNMDEEIICPCPCHRQQALDAYRDALLDQGRAEGAVRALEALVAECDVDDPLVAITEMLADARKRAAPSEVQSPP